MDHIDHRSGTMLTERPARPDDQAMRYLRGVVQRMTEFLHWPGVGVASPA